MGCDPGEIYVMLYSHDSHISLRFEGLMCVILLGGCAVGLLHLVHSL